jgi:hypothetical protein
MSPINPFFDSIGFRFNDRATLMMMKISSSEEKSNETAFFVSERSKGRTTFPIKSISMIFPLYFPSVAIWNPSTACSP